MHTTILQDKTSNYLIPPDELKKCIIIDGIEYYITPASQLKNLLDKIKDTEADVIELKNCVISILRLLGLLDEKTQNIKQSIKDGDEGYFGNIGKALLEVMTLLGKAQIPGIGKKAEAELLQKFHFIKNILPLIDKHAGK